ncbi:MAG: hypothetical protein KME35_17930 [Aphanocapsa sp. GSE-SYN-MK-11-07L]|jgi:hypothetical protein|nr:hypothetical protein [Aphanocapsa sp. GSE-SYN-MK-11-07L]
MRINVAVRHDGREWRFELFDAVDNSFMDEQSGYPSQDAATEAAVLLAARYQTWDLLSDWAHDAFRSGLLSLSEVDNLIDSAWPPLYID